MIIIIQMYIPQNAVPYRCSNRYPRTNFSIIFFSPSENFYITTRLVSDRSYLSNLSLPTPWTTYTTLRYQPLFSPYRSYPYQILPLFHRHTHTRVSNPIQSSPNFLTFLLFLFTVGWIFLFSLLFVSRESHFLPLLNRRTHTYLPSCPPSCLPALHTHTHYTDI